MTDAPIIILYHANCHDGFGGAFAAWKKLGDTARYIPAEQHTALPPDIDGAQVTLIDFCYGEDTLTELQRRAASVTILDHHATNKNRIEGHPGWQYSDEHSGCVLAWQHFHPETPAPLFLRYVEEADVWKYTLANAQPLVRWIHSQPMSFDGWDGYTRAFEQPDQLAAITEKARVYEEYFQLLVDTYERQARLVQFDGHTVLAVQAPRFLRSELAHRLAMKRPPFGIVWAYQDSGIRLSLRGDGSIDVGEIAKRHGSGGHHNAAGIFVAHELPLPFTPAND